MAGSKLLALSALAAACALSPAGAQCRLCDKPSTRPSATAENEQVDLEIESSINFDRLILSGDGAGAAVIRPDGSSMAEGTVANVGPRAMVGSAVIHGEPGRTVRVELPRRIVLYSLSGGQISMDEIVSDLPALPRLDSAGNLSFRFGGRITIRGDSEGDYRGDLPISVEYL